MTIFIYKGPKMEISQTTSYYLTGYDPSNPSTYRSMGYAPERPQKTSNKKQAASIKASSSGTGSAFTDNLDSFNTTLWHKADGWANGIPFNCGWRADHVNFQSGKMTVTLDNQSSSGKPYSSGEYRTNDFYGYGTLEGSIKAVVTDGVIGGSLFFFTDQSDGNPWDEIDIEFIKGKLQTNYFTNGVGGHETAIDLGFDPSQGFHTYKIDWQPGMITWYVDGTNVHSENGSRGALPSTACRIMANFWPGDTSVDGWLGHFNYASSLTVEYDWIKYTPYDTTPPSIPTVTDDGEYTTSSSQLYALWSSSDLESGIAEYQYSISASSFSPTIGQQVDWTSTGTSTGTTRTGLSLINGITYYFHVKSKNGVDLWSDIGHSDGISVNFPVTDTTPPSIPTITDDGESSDSLSQLHATWSSSDLESGIAEYQYSISASSFSPTIGQQVDWTSTGINTGTTRTGLSLTNGTTYYFHVKSKNGANLWSDVGHSNGIQIVAPESFEAIDNEAYQDAANGTPYSTESYSPLGTFGSIWENNGILGQVDSPNVTYQEYNAIDLVTPWANNYIDSNEWWMQQRPRGGSDVIPIHLFRLSGQNYQELPYNETIYNWGNANSGLSAVSIPSGAKYFTGFKVGHFDGNSGYPELANFKGSGYFRLTDYPPAAYGGTFRPFAHRIFNFGGNESFPTYPRAYSKVLDANHANAFFAMGSEDFTGAVNTDMYFYPPLTGVVMKINADFYPRRNISVSEESVAIAAQSTMYWRPEAHDCDTLMIKKADGTWITHQISIPSGAAEKRVVNLGPITKGDKIFISQQDRNASHYTFVPETPYQFRSSYSFHILNTNRSDLNLKVYEENTNSEINDNIVVAIELTNNLIKAEKINISYYAAAEFSPGVIIKAPNSLDGGGNWQDDTHYKIEWEAADPTSGSSITGIKIQYGDGKDSNWTTIVENTSNNGAYVWDTSAISPGNYYIKVSGINSNGKNGWDISNTQFNIPEHTLPPTPPITKPFIYPNPFKSSEGYTDIKIANVNPGYKIEIFNITGKRIFQDDISDNVYKWDACNDDGQKVASGTYLAKITDDKGNIIRPILKIGIIK